MFLQATSIEMLQRYFPAAVDLKAFCLKQMIQFDPKFVFHGFFLAQAPRATLRLTTSTGRS